ncbi:Pao retrotransposon peptidase family protein [Aphelenchoides avenae]|nr:Pao retrotransposon peptidase family protein [Aphelenchus avenae]
MLHKGPLLLNPITAVLLNSRLAPYVLSADIAKAFLQVSLREEDRHVCRFLWVRDLTKPASGDNLVIYCFNRVIFGLRPSPALLGVTIEHHMQTLDTKLSREILANCYVDNIYLTADDLAEASAKYQDSKEIFASMNMNLREFATNDTSFNSSLPKDDQARFEGFKQLGIHWDLDAVEWVFDFKVGSLNENWSPKVRRGRKKSNTTTCLEPTKRLVSSTTLSRFDPLGLVNPAILPARLAVQAACKAKYGWDDPVNTDIVDQWNKAVDCWASTETRVPRLIKPKGDEVVELHVFCDASGYSYGACAYLTVQTTEGTRSSHLVFSRSRLKPLNANLTIPRLELMAAVLGVRLIAFLQTQLTAKVSHVTLWTDSQVVFFWIQSSQKQPVFVENRLKEIRLLKELHQIQLKHVPTEYNPADVLSRGISAAKLQDHKLWWTGPSFLSGLDQWPVQPMLTEYAEAEPSFEHVVERELSLATSAKQSSLGYIVDPSEFNDWRKFLYRTYAYLYRTVCFLRALAVKRRSLGWIPVAIRKFVEDTRIFKPDEMASLKDLQATESLVLRTTQAIFPSTADEERQLRLQYDADGLLRANSRLKNAQGLPSSAYNPIYLPRQARATALLIHFHHDPARHLGTNAILASMRRRFWFTSGRRTVQVAIKLLCKECAIWNAKPLKIPEWSVLPPARVNQCKPFSHIGLDNFGSYTVRDVLEGKAGHRKVWVLIVSCLTTRAVWMDVVPDMSAESFINSFKRHMASNGTPFSVICDNATNFVAGGEALKRVTSTHRNVEPADLRRSLRQTVRRHQLRERMEAEVADETEQPTVDFKHIPEYAPWRGATYERLIGNAKYCLKRTIGHKLLSLDEFRTLIAEVTKAVNERPIAYMSERVDEFTLLRPIDFLAPLSQDRQEVNPLANNTSDARDPSYQPTKLSAVDKMVNMWTEQSQRLHTFWNMWHEMVLLGCLERGTRPDKTTSNRRPKGTDVHHLIGQYVLVKDNNAPQYKWKRAEILDLIESSDGVMRTASIRLPSGTISRRAINHLYPIEVELESRRRETAYFCSVTRVISGSTMDISKIGLHEPVELDYDEDMDLSEPADAQEPSVAAADDVGPDQEETSSAARKSFEINGLVVLPAGGPIPLLDSHLHADEVESLARRRGAAPPTYAQWSKDSALGQVYQFAGYVTVFCRPETFLSEEKVNRISADGYYPAEKSLGACAGVHPGNSEDWHSDDGLELQLVGILLKGSLGQYPLVGLGECGLDYTKKAVVRNADGRVQTRNGEPALRHAIGAKRNHQWPVFEAQIKHAKQLRRPDGKITLWYFIFGTRRARTPMSNGTPLS